MCNNLKKTVAKPLEFVFNRNGIAYTFPIDLYADDHRITGITCIEHWIEYTMHRMIYENKL